MSACVIWTYMGKERKKVTRIWSLQSGRRGNMNRGGNLRFEIVSYYKRSGQRCWTRTIKSDSTVFNCGKLSTSHSVFSN